MKEVDKFTEEIKKAIVIREVENSFLTLFGQGKLNGTVHTCVGQEFTGVFISKYLTQDDHMVTNHRGHGHYISKTGDIKGLIAELLGKEIGCSGGMGGSQHLYNKNFLSNGIQGGMVPIACGIAFAAIKSKKKFKIFVLISDGELFEGSIWESLIFASHQKLKNLVIIIDNNNQIVMDHSKDVGDFKNLKKRLSSFNFIVDEIDGHNYASLNNSLKKSKKNKKPTIILANTVKGKGISFMEKNTKWHHSIPTAEEYKMAIKELEAV